jgi:hypothetical protein
MIYSLLVIRWAIASKLFLLLVLCFIVGSAFAQSQLPRCSGLLSPWAFLVWTECLGTYEFEDGGKYEGEFKNGKPHGNGTWTFASGDRYDGGYKEGLHHGRGTLTSANGFKYVGDWKNGKQHGEGKTSFPNGDTFIGERKDGKAQGFGIYVYADGRDSKEGVWESNRFVRADRIPTPLASRFIDKPLDMQASPPVQSPCDPNAEPRTWTRCTGSITNSGGTYVGEYLSGKPHGRGVITLSDGTRYEGDFKNGKKEGRGEYTFPNGDRYAGEYRDDGRDGQGTYLHLAEGRFKGERYVGNFREGKPEGLGAHYFPYGNVYEGEFKNGLFEGQGRYTFANGDTYVGQHARGMAQGLGVATYTDGRPPKEGLWRSHKFVKAQVIPDSVAGRTGASQLVQSPRQLDLSRSTLSLVVTPSRPDPDGIVTLVITTNGDTASLMVNGVDEGARADGRYSIRKFAQVGDNKFEIVAVDRAGNTQTRIVSLVRAVEEATMYVQPLNPIRVSESKPRDAVAIIIGIEKYRSVGLASFADKDARVFYDYARRALGVRPENIKLLVDDKADAAEILVTFKNWLPARVKKGSTDVYVFYSGHGLPSEDGNSLYLLPHEARTDLLERTAISQSELVAAIQKSSPKSVTMFLDSCYSGQSRTGETLLASARPISVKAKQSTFPKNFTVISASAPDQYSYSSPDLKHGIFSYYLMRGMEGEADTNKDKQITVAEMQAYLAENVTRRAMGMNRTQQPQVVGDQSRVLVGR